MTDDITDTLPDAITELPDAIDQLRAKFLRRLMASDALIWATRNGTAVNPKGETLAVLAEWRAECRAAERNKNRSSNAPVAFIGSSRDAA